MSRTVPALGPLPFGFNQAQPLRDNTPYLGLWIRLLNGEIAPNPDYRLTHNLRVVPRFCWLLDAGVSGIAGPLPRGLSPWNAAGISLNLPHVPAGSALLLAIG